MASLIPPFIAERLEQRRNQEVGYLAEFADPGALYDATKAVRKAGYDRIDTFSPFPIHGIGKAMGLKHSPLGYITFVGGLIGMSLAILMQWWMSAVDYPINISNKPLFAIESAVPITFEVTVLFSALAAVGGMLALNGLPRPYNPLFYSSRFARATDDAFFLHVPAQDGSFDRGETARQLFDLGALGVEYVDHDGAYDVGPDGGPLEAEPALASEPAAPPADADPARPETPPHTTGAI